MHAIANRPCPFGIREWSGVCESVNANRAIKIHYHRTTHEREGNVNDAPSMPENLKAKNVVRKMWNAYVDGFGCSIEDWIFIFSHADKSNPILFFRWSESFNNMSFIYVNLICWVFRLLFQRRYGKGEYQVPWQLHCNISAQENFTICSWAKRR